MNPHPPVMMIFFLAMLRGIGMVEENSWMDAATYSRSSGVIHQPTGMEIKVVSTLSRRGRWVR